MSAIRNVFSVREWILACSHVGMFFDDGQAVVDGWQWWVARGGLWL